jgi:agmatine/peptidylarginine deiminase
MINIQNVMCISTSSSDDFKNQYVKKFFREDFLLDSNSIIFYKPKLIQHTTRLENNFYYSEQRVLIPQYDKITDKMIMQGIKCKTTIIRKYSWHEVINDSRRFRKFFL